MPWKKLRSKRGADLKIFSVRFDYLRNPRNGKEAKVTVLESQDSANIVAHTKAGKLVMIEQFRFGIGEHTLELPGGLIDEGEEPLEAAKRELREESGYTSSRWGYLGKCQSNPVYMDSYIHHFVCYDAEKTHGLDLDEEEDIAVKELSTSQLKEAWESGQLMHPHVISALAYAGLL